MTRVLLTAFEPFGGEQVNPSQLAVQRLATQELDGVELRTAFLPVVYYTAAEALRAALDEHRPDIVICVGQTGGRFGITPEKVAINRNDTVLPDNAGQAPIDEAIVTDGPVGYFTGLPVAAIVEALHEADIPAQISWSAGAYVCNHVFYSLMHVIETEQRNIRGGFVHVPYVHEQVARHTETRPSLSLHTIIEALRVTVITTVNSIG
jgi:pyroglutamyl-peptidase